MVRERLIKGSYDLHAHSAFSDGSQTVSELIAEARERGLAGIAVVDHDSLRQLSSVRAEARAAGFPVLAGDEVSCIDATSGRKVHILVYGLEATPDGCGPLERIVDAALIPCGRPGPSSERALPPAGTPPRLPACLRSRTRARASTSNTSCKR